MFQHYFKLAYRNLYKSKGNSFIHIFGLTIGLTGCLLLGLFILDELKYDDYHPNVTQTFRVYSQSNDEHNNSFWAGTSPAIAPTLKNDFPEVEQTLRLYHIRSKYLFQSGAQQYLEEGGVFAEASIFDLFHLPLEQGDPKTALREPNAIVLTNKLAKKYFGQENPIEQTILINNKERKITGVLAPLPAHTHLQFNYLVAFNDLLSQVSKERMQSWVWQDFVNYIKLRPNTDLESFKSKLPAFVEKHAHEETKKVGFYYYLNLQAINDVYLHSSHIRNDFAKKGSYQYLLGLGAVGLFLLIIACINFINLSTAKALNRAKEVGVRKTAGAQRSQLTIQFIGEAVLIVCIAAIFAIQLSHLLLPYLNNFADKSMTFNEFGISFLLMGILIISLFIGVLAGAYPAFIMSGFRPVEALKGNKIQVRGEGQWLRKILVTLQFTLSIFLIISVLIIFQQIDFLSNKALGFDKEQLVHFPMKKGLFKDTELSKNAFLKIAGVEKASTCFGIPGDIVAGDNIIIPGESRRELSTSLFAIDHDYIQTMGIEIIAGRNFSKDIQTDALQNFIINETAVKELGIAENPQEAVGKKLEWKGWDKDQTIKKGKIIGVVKDFHHVSLHEEVSPAVLHIYPQSYWKMALRVNTTNLGETIAGIEAEWDRFDTGYPIDFQFVDEDFKKMYSSEEKLSELLRIFAILAIIISCIGAFGLTTYATERRRKEIGIRKVLGASTGSVMVLLTRDFLKLVFVALLLASPIAWYYMQNWLQSFAYCIDIQIWIFLIAGFLVLMIAFLTVGFNSLRAALENPIQCLHSE